MRRLIIFRCYKRAVQCPHPIEARVNHLASMKAQQRERLSLLRSLPVLVSNNSAFWIAQMVLREAKKSPAKPTSILQRAAALLPRVVDDVVNRHYSSSTRPPEFPLQEGYHCFKQVHRTTHLDEIALVTSISRAEDGQDKLKLSTRLTSPLQVSGDETARLFIYCCVLAGRVHSATFPEGTHTHGMLMDGCAGKDKPRTFSSREASLGLSRSAPTNDPVQVISTKAYHLSLIHI